MNWKKILIILLVISGAGMILLVSVSRASLEVVNREEMEDTIRVESVKIGDKTIYKLPQTGILPGNPLYIFKEARNWLWEKFSFGEERKARILLLLADKKMAECRKLVENGEERLAFESGVQALDKLKYAYTVALGIRNDSIEKKQILKQIDEASLAYEIITGELKDKSIQQKLNDFQKEEIQKKTYLPQ
ncbi:MAG: DUF5667 domain-containing protein [Candidatus Shapirobacteria bacterium]|jgi:hypothetical protein